MDTGNLSSIVVVAGPTAGGKTPLALRLAESCQGEIVNFDSVQVYRDFDIGAAKPSAAEMERVPHHLIGVVNAATPLTAGEYARRARPVVEDIITRGKLPILVGGTGFYLRSLLEGISPAPPSEPKLRARLQLKSAPQLRALLERLDPESAARIAPADAPKAIRALEVRLTTGRTVGEHWRAAPPEPLPGVRILKYGLSPPRPALYERINARAAAMFAGPILEEAARLLPRYPADLRIWTSHGYKQACDLLLRGAAPAPALAEAQQEQRNYAKRQWTWFRRDPAFIWLEGFGDDLAIQAAAVAQAKRWLADSHPSGQT